jgi:hypothetical protein
MISPLKSSFRLNFFINLVPTRKNLHLFSTLNLGSLLGVFAKLRKTAISFVMSDRLSVCPHGTTQLPLDGLS